MHLIGRINAELRTRGPVGFLRFIGTRLWQRRDDLLFEILLPGGCVAAARGGPQNLVVVTCENCGSRDTAATERDVLTGQNYAYREALAGRDILFAITEPDGRVSAYGFVLFDSFYKRVLGEALDVPMIGNCYTFPDYRRQGLYAALLVAICHHLTIAGYHRAIITCAPDNLASVHGIRRAGFSQVKTLRSWIVFSRLIVRQICAMHVVGTKMVDDGA